MMKVQQFADNFMALVGDTTESTPESFIIAGINWCFNELPLTPKLGKLFSKHYKPTLDAKGHYKWSLNGDFRKLSEVPMLNFYTSNGGEVCKLKICFQDVEDFYTRNGLIELKKPGIPCHYTLEEEGDEMYLVLDRPSNVPIILDYIAYGFPKPIKSMNDEIELSAVAEHLMTGIFRSVWYQEMDDWNVSQSLYDYIDNKYIPEAEQLLNRRIKAAGPIILGEV